MNEVKNLILDRNMTNDKLNKNKKVNIYEKFINKSEIENLKVIIGNNNNLMEQYKRENIKLNNELNELKIK